jgi:hypothetical protein
MMAGKHATGVLMAGRFAIRLAVKTKSRDHIEHSGAVMGQLAGASNGVLPAQGCVLASVLGFDPSGAVSAA